MPPDPALDPSDSTLEPSTPPADISVPVDDAQGAPPVTTVPQAPAEPVDAGEVASSTMPDMVQTTDVQNGDRTYDVGAADTLPIDDASTTDATAKPDPISDIPVQDASSTASTTHIQTSDVQNEAPVQTETQVQTSDVQNAAQTSDVNTEPVPVAPATPLQWFLDKARLTVLSRRQKRLDRIMTLFTTHTQIDNVQLQLLLHVSASAASKYLSILVTEGHIHQIGKIGHSQAFEKI